MTTKLQHLTRQTAATLSQAPGELSTIFYFINFAHPLFISLPISARVRYPSHRPFADKVSLTQANTTTLTMARTKKKRFCEGIISGKAFKPIRRPLSELKQVELFYDEIEALRLCDLEGLTQEQAGQQMGVSRGTVQRILTTARKKTASAIVNGEALMLTDPHQ